MKITANREALLKAYGITATVAPARSPKAILSSLKIVAESHDETTLMATDLEVGIRHRVSLVQVHEPGSAILPPKIGEIIRSSSDDELSIEVDGDRIIVRNDRSRWVLPSEDPALFPEVPCFAATAYHVIAAADLKRLIRRTIIATDPESTRFALGGCLVEVGYETISFVGTDGRRLAKMTATCQHEGDIEGKPGHPLFPVIPVKALKLIERHLDDKDAAAHIAIDKSAALIRTETATIYSRLCEGRYPRYSDVFPDHVDATIPLEVGTFATAIQQAAIVTSEESRGVDFVFESGMLKLSTESADVGKSSVELPVAWEGDRIGFTLDPAYVSDALKTLDDTDAITLEIAGPKGAVVFKSGEYVLVVMPLTRDR